VTDTGRLKKCSDCKRRSDGDEWAGEEKGRFTTGCITGKISSGPAQAKKRPNDQNHRSRSAVVGSGGG